MTAEVKVVPVEPTEAMHYDGDRALVNALGRCSVTETTLKVWSAMLAASPPAETGEGSYGFLFEDDDGTEWNLDDPRVTGENQYATNVRPATAKQAVEQMLSAWAATSGADGTPLMWVWSEMPEQQRNRWEAIAAAVLQSSTDAGGAVSEAMVDAAVAVTGDGRAITLGLPEDEAYAIQKAWGAFMGATSPATVLDLLATIARLEAEKVKDGEALEAITALGSDGEHSGDRHAQCRQIARARLSSRAKDQSQ